MGCALVAGISDNSPIQAGPTTRGPHYIGIVGEDFGLGPVYVA